MPKTPAERQAERRDRLASLTPVEKVRDKLQAQRIFNRPPDPVYTPAERAKVQASHDFIVYATTALSAGLSGVLQAQVGWQIVNMAALSTYEVGRS